IKSLSPGVAMIVSTYIERPILVDIRTRKSKHGGASVPVVKDPLDQTPATRVISTGIDEKPIINSQKIIDNARNIIESPRAIINKAKTIIESKPEPKAEQKPEPKAEQKKPEQPQHHEEVKEQIERKKGKRETSLYRKMFGSGKK
ncbi:MAG: hypothetical protein QSU88_11020, partial [Candidatus Methanoperedens sp.]|nr:hypothetical protein [Candidatus Methanoperedens sp.]